VSTTCELQQNKKSIEIDFIGLTTYESVVEDTSSIVSNLFSVIVGTSFSTIGKISGDVVSELFTKSGNALSFNCEECSSVVVV
jgi:hypothetical protein